MAHPARRTRAELEGVKSTPGEAEQSEPAERSRPDWLRNLLTVSGPAGEVRRFREAARGTAGIPWHLDVDQEVARLFGPMASGGLEARALAQKLRERIAARHDRVLSRWMERGACPLDLHRLIPIPHDILQLGEDDPRAHAWLFAHWGTRQKLRAVRIREEGADRRLRRKAEIVYEFWSADTTPWQALLQLRRGWPKLILVLQPRYDDG